MGGNCTKGQSKVAAQNDDEGFWQKGIVAPVKHFRLTFDDLNGWVQLFFDNASTTLILVNIVL